MKNPLKGLALIAVISAASSGCRVCVDANMIDRPVSPCYTTPAPYCEQTCPVYANPCMQEPTN